MARNILLTSLSAAENDLPVRFFSFRNEFGFDYCDALLDTEASIKATLARYSRKRYRESSDNDEYNVFAAM